ncbi:MFS transporter [Streptomyces sp. CA-278952]|uniref:MFS transporter n=1 Tax=Streptomyces sp. CA-278952 TaxID=2980556 RepID=UPI002367B1D1|nr:MFS transporter [Streptomyces sp. CA-278952]WDG29804.1 MFS transporter [Streptomyces sp. CA-278952]
MSVSTDTAGVSPPATEEHRRKAKKATAVAAFGTFIEYYDFSVYGYVAATLAIVFFPSDNPTVGLLNTFLVFGSAFAVRPLGALFFGRLGDRAGRRVSLIASIGLMSLAAALTGLLPGYASIGVAAPILLIILRMLQGFSTGGEIGGAASYIREWAPKERRSLYISFIPGVAVFGKACAAGMAALAATLIPESAMESWGWRIPFLLAVPLGLLCLYLRLKIEDTPEFRDTQSADRSARPDRKPFKELMADYPGPLGKVMAISTVQNVGTYVGTVFVASYLSSVLDFSEGEAATIVLLAVLAAAVFIPLCGQFGSRVGGKRVLIVSYIAYVALTIPSFWLMGRGSVGLAIAGLLLGMIPYALCQAGTYAAMPEFFPVQVRHTGVAFGHSVGAVIGGGAGPYASTWLIDSTGSTLVPAYILVFFGLFGLAVVLGLMRPSASRDHLYA